MTNYQGTKRRSVMQRAFEVPPRGPNPHWSFAVGIWSFPHDSRGLFENNAGEHCETGRARARISPVPGGRLGWGDRPGCRRRPRVPPLSIWRRGLRLRCGRRRGCLLRDRLRRDRPRRAARGGHPLLELAAGTGDQRREVTRLKLFRCLRKSSRELATGVRRLRAGEIAPPGC
jgi:hypothetical protein